MNREQSLLPEEEFVFGAFTSPQLAASSLPRSRVLEEKTSSTFV